MASGEEAAEVPGIFALRVCGVDERLCLQELSNWKCAGGTLPTTIHETEVWWAHDHLLKLQNGSVVVHDHVVIVFFKSLKEVTNNAQESSTSLNK